MTNESSATMTSAAPKHRPIGMTILAILALFGAAIAFIYTLQMLHLLPVTIGPVRFWTFDLWGAILWGILAFIYLWVFRMLWMVNPQGWMFVVLLSGLNLILAFLSVLGGSSWEAMSASIVVNGIILVYALLPGTKKAFGV
ncbi:MAG: hypothetical protein LUQ47_05230 [Methanotrichaceae archaeon]|jgi:hypothetical protein|nr:hypothetical protein [Methanotrichaceae archaeon]